MKRIENTDPDTIQDAVKRMPSEVRLMLEKRLELMALDLSEGVSVILSRILFIMFGGITLGIAVLFSMMGLSYYIGELLNSTALGYLITAVPLLVIGVFLFNKKPRILYENTKKWMLKQFIELISKNNLD